MGYQTIFKRYELKYLLDITQKEQILQAMAPYMRPDSYGRSTIRNLYFDNPSYQLIRRSVEKPEYKEKLRIRCYETATADSTVFVELKKKYKKVVYKRRLSLTEQQAMDWLCGGTTCAKPGQIAREIEYFMSYYQGLRPSVYLSYQREAFYAKDDGEFRVTFDDNILCRQHDLTLTCPPGGAPLLGTDQVLMEIKCDGGIPMWMVKLLSEHRLYKTSFSKYGTAYETMIVPRMYQNAKEAVCNE